VYPAEVSDQFAPTIPKELWSRTDSFVFSGQKIMTAPAMTLGTTSTMLIRGQCSKLQVEKAGCLGEKN